MHLASGAAAEERDAAFRKVREGGPNPDKSADPETQSEFREAPHDTARRSLS